MATPTPPPPQAFRSVFRVGNESQPAPNSPNADLVPRLDKKTGEYIILWRDILRIFKDAKYILHGSEAVNFMTDDDFEELQPLRISPYPGELLDVVLEPEALSPGIATQFTGMSTQGKGGPPSNYGSQYADMLGPGPGIQQPPLYGVQLTDMTASGPGIQHPLYGAQFKDISASGAGAKSPTIDTWFAGLEAGVQFPSSGGQQNFQSLNPGTSQPNVSNNFTLNTTDQSTGEERLPDTPFVAADRNPPSSTTAITTTTTVATASTTQPAPGISPQSAEDRWFDHIESVLGAEDTNNDASNVTTTSRPLSEFMDFFKTEIMDADRHTYNLPPRDAPLIDLLTGDETNEILIDLDDPTPIISDPTPVISYPLPVISDSIPAISDPTPVISDPTPIMSDPTPVMSDPSPVVSDATVQHSQVTPVLAQDNDIKVLIMEDESSIGPPKSDKSPVSIKIKSGVRRAPQAADVDPLNLAEAPSDVQGRILTYMRQIQSLAWEEASMPRVFIVLPKSCPASDQTTAPSDGFRFFWMCEHSCDHPDGADDQSGYGSSPYLQSIHHGFILDRPPEFFDKYGVHLLLNLQLFMYSRRSATDGYRGSKTPSVGYDQGVEFLRMSLNMTSREQVEQSLDWMISYLITLTLDSMAESQLLQPQIGAASMGSTHLEQHDLRLLRSFLIPSPGSVGLEENLYRSVDESGKVQWVCFTHYYELHPFFFPGYIQEAVGKCGGYNYNSMATTPTGSYSPKVGQVSVRPRSSNETLDLFSSLVAGSGCVPDLVLRFNWDVSLSDMRYIRDAVLCFGVVSLVLLGSGLQHASDKHAELLVQMLEHPKVQSFSLDSAQGLLGHINPLMLMDRPFDSLRTLRLTVGSSGSGSEDVDRGLVSVVQNSYNLRSLWVTWEAMEEVIGIEAFLRAIATRDGSQPLDVSLIVRQQTILLTIEQGEFQKVSVQSANLDIAETNPLVLSGIVQRLRIVDRINAHDEHSTIWHILSINHGLQMLELDCSADTFKSTEEMVNGIVRVLPDCTLSSLTLRDSSRGSSKRIYHGQIGTTHMQNIDDVLEEAHL
ncbi:hypothetical protein B0O80DRAFT_275503 [Mortierella sp. GBAus27b]|nr:hypothetical protein BGX31_009306 [Mortierella sp. GBA43]KAI8358177.1 hypothetical protein B0O80DRAFT_275503 [Mortierella sp. GBAus27b]